MINDYKDSFKFDQKTEGDLNFLTFTFLNPDKAFTWQTISEILLNGND